MPILLSLFFAYASPVRSSESSPQLAGRGIDAYRTGNYDLARLFFKRSLQDAILKGHEEWKAKAVMNLVELDLDALNSAEARALLEKIHAPKNPELLSIFLWKKSQVAFMEKSTGEALIFVDSALLVAEGLKTDKIPLLLDRYRYLAAERAPTEWRAGYEAFRISLTKKDRARARGLDAAISMTQGNFTAAEVYWKEAIQHYRGRGALSRLAAAMNQIALCQFAQGRMNDALISNSQAVAIYRELGLALPGLKAQALRLLLLEGGKPEDHEDLAKLRQEIDLLNQTVTGFNLQETLDEFSRIMSSRPLLH